MDVNILNRQENQLVFTTFNQEIAEQLTQSMAEAVLESYDKPVGIDIFYDDELLIHYLMKGKEESSWLSKKRKTVLKSGHSSLFVYENRAHSIYQHWTEDPEHAICGGGFPIKVNGVLRGAICVSGLNHLDDHQVIIQAVTKILKIAQ